ncbi:hypothetical protein [Embleya scabrispora]|uniref:hypothetical protein n=1 Tax=Embleya scabrispora TaxID=159449 RepID=UPI001374EF90|nr:hypothetical protein [Embleya scabrispora]
MTAGWDRPDPVRGGWADAADEPFGAEELLRTVAERQPALPLLAQALCLAPCAAPVFVRRARIEFVPDSTASLEADLWFSPLVESADPNALVLAPDVAAVLRTRLALDARRWARVLRLTEHMQERAPELVRRYTRLAVAEVMGAHPRDIEPDLTAFRYALMPDGTTGDDLARWLVHFLPRLPGVLETSAPARTLVDSAAARLRVEPPTRTGTPSGFGATVRRGVRLGVRCDEDGLTLSRPPEPGDRVLEVPGGLRVRVELAAPGEPASGGYAVELAAGESVHVPIVVFADLAARRAGSKLPTERRLLLRTRTVFGATAALADGDLRAAVRPTEGGTELLRSFRGEVWSTERLAEAAELSDLDGTSGIVLLRVGDEVIVVEQTSLSRARRLRPGKIRAVAIVGFRVIVVSERGVWATPFGARSDLEMQLSRTAEAGTRIQAGHGHEEVLIVSARGEVEIVHLSTGARTRFDSRFEPRPITAIAGGAPGGALVLAQTGPRLVRVPSSGPAQTVEGEALRADLTSLAIVGHTSLAVDADGRMLRWEGDLPIQPPDEVPLPFSPLRVSPKDYSTFTVVGRGGPVELRTQDGRSVLVTPRRRDETSTDRVADALIATMPLGPGAADFARLRRYGIGCACLPFRAEAIAAADGRPDAEVWVWMRAAGAAGMRVLVDVPTEHVARVRGEIDAANVLRYCRALLAAGAFGIRIVRSRYWWSVVERGAPPVAEGNELLGILRDSVDEYPGRLLVLDCDLPNGPTGWNENDGFPPAMTRSPPPQGGRGIRVPQASLILDPSEEEVRMRSIAPYEGALGRSVSLSVLTEDAAPLTWACASILLARPGLRAVATLPSGPTNARLAAMLRAHRDEPALARGTATRLPSLHEDVVVLLRRHEDEVVLCAANLGDIRRAVALTTPGTPQGTLVELLDTRRPQILDIRAGSPAMLVLDPCEYRWFRLLGPDELYASGS